MEYRLQVHWLDSIVVELGCDVEELVVGEDVWSVVEKLGKWSRWDIFVD